MTIKQMKKLSTNDLIYIGCIKITSGYDYLHAVVNKTGNIMFMLNYYNDIKYLVNLSIYDVSDDAPKPLKRYTVFRPTKMGRYELAEIGDKIREIEVFVETNSKPDTYITFAELTAEVNSIQESNKKEQESFLEKLLKFFKIK